MSTDALSTKKIHTVELGKVGRPHGVRGDVRLFLHHPDSSLINTLSVLFLVNPENGNESECVIHSVKAAARFHILTLKDVRNREQAQRLNGFVVKVPRDVLPSPEEGEYYVADLMGMTVTCDGVVIGRIVDSRAQGGVEVISVENEEREIQIPMVDAYVVERDMSSMVLEVTNIDSLPVYEFARKGS